MSKVTTVAETLGVQPDPAGDRCQEEIVLPDGPGPPRSLVVRCERLVVNAQGQRVEHIHHRRSYNIPGVERAMTTWTRRA